MKFLIIFYRERTFSYEVCAVFTGVRVGYQLQLQPGARTQHGQKQPRPSGAVQADGTQLYTLLVISENNLLENKRLASCKKKT